MAPTSAMTQKNQLDWREKTFAHSSGSSARCNAKLCRHCLQENGHQVLDRMDQIRA
jgi:hypothetical protein